jgi:hypothetical protein
MRQEVTHWTQRKRAEEMDSFARFSLAIPMQLDAAVGREAAVDGNDGSGDEF